MRGQLLLAALAFVGLSGAIAFGQLSQGMKEDREGLLSRATYSAEAARQQALAAVPGGVIVESEIEEEDGRLVYCFEIKVAGHQGVTEVEIDAVTGELLGTAQEADDDEEEEDAGDTD